MVDAVELIFIGPKMAMDTFKSLAKSIFNSDSKISAVKFIDCNENPNLRPTVGAGGVELEGLSVKRVNIARGLDTPAKKQPEAKSLVHGPIGQLYGAPGTMIPSEKCQKFPRAN